MSKTTAFTPTSRTCCDSLMHLPHAADCGREEYDKAKAGTFFNETTGLVHCGHCHREHPGGSPLLPVWPTNHQHEAWLRASYARERHVQDEADRLLQQVGYLMDRCRQLLAGSRPSWWREAVRWWNGFGRHDERRAS